MKFVILSLLSAFLLCTVTQSQSVITFEDQSFGTESWTENGINWTLGGWANIRSYQPYNGSNHAMFLNGNYLEGDHHLNINSLWIYIDDNDDANTYVDFKGYNSSGSLVKTQRYDVPNFMFDYEHVSLSGFSNITKLVLEFDDNIGFGLVDVYVDDVNYDDLGALPVELSSFKASVTNSKVELNWRTETEVDNYGFQVERLKDSKIARFQEWETIGFVNGHGNSNSVKEYSFIDEEVSAGKYSYRLKQIDTDGDFEYSKEIEVEINNLPTQFALYQNYPNPFNPATKIKYAVPSGVRSFVELKVYDILGKAVATLVNEAKEPGDYEIEWNAGNLSSGIYFYKLQAGSFTDTKKFILMK